MKLKKVDFYLLFLTLVLALGVHGVITSRFLFNPTASMFEGQRVATGDGARLASVVLCLACLAAMAYLGRMRLKGEDFDM